MTLALTAFIDETGTHAGHPITAVAGFLYEQSSVDEFEIAWAKRTVELREPFHTADCFGGYEQFEGWPAAARLMLMHDFAEIISKTRSAGVISFVTHDDWEKWSRLNTQALQHVGSPYSLCLLDCMNIIGGVASRRHPDQLVQYVFEAGSDRQAEAASFLRFAGRNRKLMTQFRLAGHRFSRPSLDPLLCAADFLAWEWQRNYTEALEDEAQGRTSYWRSEFQVLRNADPERLYLHHLVGGGITVWGLTNAFNEKGLHD